MDIKVLVEDVAREVCGISHSTTCEDIIVKLAQAANLPGFYTLVAMYRGRQDILSADERIIDFFRRRGVQPQQVQFVLRRLEALLSPAPAHSESMGNRTKTSHSCPNTVSSNMGGSVNHPSHPKSLEIDYSAAENEVRSPQTSVSSRPPSSFSSQQPSSRVVKQPSQNTAVARRVLTPVADSQPSKESPGEYELLEDQLAVQEQEVELNRIKLLQLDKEIAELEKATFMLTNSELALAGGPAAELSHLAATPWSKLLERNRSMEAQLSQERERYQIALDRVDTQLEQTKNEALQLEAKAAQELNGLLSTLDRANAQRRDFLRSLSPTPFPARASASNKSSGVPV